MEMELPPAARPAPADRPGARSVNERRILHAIRGSGPMSKAEIARATGLSAQAVSVIVERLRRERLVRKERKVRGQVGQPFTPIALDPAGARSIGLKLGRRSLELATVDFLGEVVDYRQRAYDAPHPETVMAAARAVLGEAVAAVGAGRRGTIAGVGVAMPGEMHGWCEELGVPPGALDGWRTIDVAAELEAASGLPVTVYNDATAACAAEMAAGETIAADSVLYVFVGAFVGGGVVVDGRLHVGAQGNAGAIGSMPMAERDAAGRPEQLIRRASLIYLEREFAGMGIDARAVIKGAADDPRAEPVFAAWRQRAAEGLARMATAAASVIDFEAMVIDGILRSEWLEALVSATRAALAGFSRSGLSPMAVERGRVGERARALGAALLPLHAMYAPEASLPVVRGGERRAPASGEPAQFEAAS